MVLASYFLYFHMAYETETAKGPVLGFSANVRFFLNFHKAVS